MAIELIGFDELKLYLGLAKTESDYPELTLIQESVVDAIEEYTGRKLAQDKYTRTDYIHDKTRMISLEALPVSEITSFTVDGETVSDFVFTNYGLYLKNSIQDVTIVVSYKGGLSSIPVGLKRAALLQTVYEYQNKDSIGIEVVNTDGGSVVKPELGLLKPVKTLLNKYKHPMLVL